MESELQSLGAVAENVAKESVFSNDVIGTRRINAGKPDGRFNARIVVQGFETR